MGAAAQSFVGKSLVSSGSPTKYMKILPFESIPAIQYIKYTLSCLYFLVCTHIQSVNSKVS